MQQYIDLLNKVMDTGTESGDRTGTGTVSVFGTNMRFNLRAGFPLLTTKKVAFDSMKCELLWFLEGSTDNNRLKELGSKIWNPWATESGDLGPIYGSQWINWQDTRLIKSAERFKYPVEKGWAVAGELPDSTLVIQRTINQIAELVNNLKNNPRSRRHLVTAWNPSVLPDETISPQTNVELGNASLASCHAFFQMYAREMNLKERLEISDNETLKFEVSQDEERYDSEALESLLDEYKVPKYSLSCRIYQR